MGRAAEELVAANRELGGALKDTSTWANEEKKNSPHGGIAGVIGRVSAYAMGFRPVRAIQRYGAARGALLAGGIAYSALFAIAGALAIAFTVFSVILGGNPELFDSVVGQIDKALPGVLKTGGSSEGLLDPQSLILPSGFNPVTIISTIVLIWSAVALMTNLRISIQAMFGISRLPVNFVVSKLLDLSGFVILGVAIVLTTALSAITGIFADVVFQFLNIPSSWGSALLRIASLAIALVVDMGVFAFLFRVMAGVRAPWKDLLAGAFVGGLASALVRFLGTSAVGSVADKPLLAPFAAIITVLLWVNLVARITLIAAAFTANPPEQMVLKPEYFEHHNETPNYVTKSVVETLAWDFDPISGVVIPDLEVNTEEVPEWKGLRGKLAKRKLEAARSALDEAKVRAREAEQEYRDGAWRAYTKRTRPSTNGAASAAAVRAKRAKDQQGLEDFVKGQSAHVEGEK